MVSPALVLRIARNFLYNRGTQKYSTTADKERGGGWLVGWCLRLSGGMGSGDICPGLGVASPFAAEGGRKRVEGDPPIPPPPSQHRSNVRRSGRENSTAAEAEAEALEEPLPTVKNEKGGRSRNGERDRSLA